MWEKQVAVENSVPILEMYSVFDIISVSPFSFKLNCLFKYDQTSSFSALLFKMRNNPEDKCIAYVLTKIAASKVFTRGHYIIIAVKFHNTLTIKKRKGGGWSITHVFRMVIMEQMADRLGFHVVQNSISP